MTRTTAVRISAAAPPTKMAVKIAMIQVTGPKMANRKYVAKYLLVYRRLKETPAVGRVAKRGNGQDREDQLPRGEDDEPDPVPAVVQADVLRQHRGHERYRRDDHQVEEPQD